MYCAYFGYAVGDQDKVWSAHYCCLDWSGKLSKWFSGKKVDVGFAVPMIWREQRDHITDCYFCLAKTKDYNQRNRKEILYPNLPSVILPVPRSANLTIPIPPLCLPELKGESSENSENLSCDSDDTFQLNQEATKPHLISQEDLNDLERDSNLTKSNSELLASFLKQWNLLAPNTKVMFYLQRSQDLISLLMANCTIAMMFLHYLQILA